MAFVEGGGGRAFESDEARMSWEIGAYNTDDAYGDCNNGRRTAKGIAEVKSN